MKQFFIYLRSKTVPILLFFLFTAIFAAEFALCSLPLGAVLYPAALCFLIGAAYVIIDFSREKKKHAALLRSAENASLLSHLPDPSTLSEDGYDTLVRALGDELTREKTESSATYSDTVDYFTVWAHQVKTPISSMRLALDGEDSDLSRRLKSDLFRIGQYADMVLAHLRLGSPSTDYVFTRCTLDSVIVPSVKKFSSEFISRRLSLTYEPIETAVLTDEKWLAFIIEQLLSNSLKYTREGGITIKMKDSRTLSLIDTGIGISSEDLPRITEKGYTGTNGRTHREASGLGLYLCRRIAENLSLDLKISSAVGHGTEVDIVFPEDKTAVE